MLSRGDTKVTKQSLVGDAQDTTLVNLSDKNFYFAFSVSNLFGSPGIDHPKYISISLK